MALALVLGVVVVVVVLLLLLQLQRKNCESFVSIIFKAPLVSIRLIIIT